MSIWEQYLEKTRPRVGDVPEKNPVPILHPLSPRYAHATSWLPATLYGRDLDKVHANKKCEQCNRLLMPDEILIRHNDLHGHMTDVTAFCPSFRGKLFLGALWNAASARDLSFGKINIVVPMAVETSTKLFPNTLQYKLQWLWFDDDEFILPDLCEAMDWLFCFPNNEVGRNVLIHCYQGRSRSVTLVLAAMIYDRHRTQPNLSVLLPPVICNECGDPDCSKSNDSTALCDNAPGFEPLNHTEILALLDREDESSHKKMTTTHFKMAFADLRSIRLSVKPNSSYHSQLQLWDHVFSSLGIWPMSVLGIMYGFLANPRDRFLYE